NNAGRIAFFGILAQGSGAVTSTNDTGIWSAGSGSLSLVAREGSAAPGAGAGAVFTSFFTPVLNGAGHTAFRGFLLNGAGGVTSANDFGVWSEGTGTLSLVAREGSQAPDTPAGAVYSNFNDVAMNGLDHVAFTASLLIGSGGVVASNANGLWAEDPSGLL